MAPASRAQKKKRTGIGVHYPIPVFPAKLGYGSKDTRSGTVYQYIKPTKLTLDFIEHLSNLLLILEIRLDVDILGLPRLPPLSLSSQPQFDFENSL